MEQGQRREAIGAGRDRSPDALRAASRCCSRSPARALAFTILAGGAISLQSYLNGRLGKDVGSATIAAAIDNAVAFVATLAIVLATRALPRAARRLRARGAAAGLVLPRRVGGAALVLVSARRRRRSASRC